MKTIITFGYNLPTQLPEGCPVIDCRVIKNPYSNYKHDPEGARRVVRSDPFFEQLVKRGTEALLMYDTVAVGCLYGVHRSGTVAEEILHRMLNLGFDATIDKRGKA